MAFRMNCRVLRFRPPARPHNDGAGVSVPNAVASASFASDYAQSIAVPQTGMPAPARTGPADLLSAGQG
jgi:hypothetical protein